MSSAVSNGYGSGVFPTRLNKKNEKRTMNFKLRTPITQDDIIKRNFTMDEMMAMLGNKEALSTLYTFATTIYSEENIYFLKTYIDIRDNLTSGMISANELRSNLYTFLCDFFGNDSPYELNVPDTSMEKIREIRQEIISSEINLNKEAIIETLDVIHKLISTLTATNCAFPYSVHLNGIEKRLCDPSISEKTRVVIVGGGFAGSSVAAMLDRLPETFHVTLIERKSVFEHTPSLVQALVSPDLYPSFKVDYTSIVKNGIHMVENATQILHDRVMIGENVGVPYDYIVLSMGSRYGSQLKTEDATQIFRKKNIHVQHAILEKSQSVLIIGGGLVGTELASEIKGIYPEKKVTLVDPHNRLMKNCHPKTSELAKKALEKLGVELVFKKRVVDYNSIDKSYVCDDSFVFHADMVHWCTGLTPNTEILSSFPELSILDEDNLVRVRKTLQVKEYDNMFAGGDIKNLKEPKLAFRAIIDSFVITRNILRIEKAKRLKKKGSFNLQHEDLFLYRTSSSSTYDSASDLDSSSAPISNNIGAKKKNRKRLGILKSIKGNNGNNNNDSDVDSINGSTIGMNNADEHNAESPLNNNYNNNNNNNNDNDSSTADFMSSSSDTVNIQDNSTIDIFSDVNKGSGLLQLKVELVQRGTHGAPGIQAEKKYLATSFTVGPKREDALFSQVTPLNGVIHLRGARVYDIKDCFRNYVKFILTNDKKEFFKQNDSKNRLIIEAGLGKVPAIEKYRAVFEKLNR